MSGCVTCGGYGMRHDPIAHGTVNDEPYRGDCTAMMRLTQVDPDVEVHAWCTLEDGHDGWHRTRRLSWPQLDPDSWEPLP